MLSVLEQRFMETVIRQLLRITENLEKLVEMQKTKENNEVQNAE